ncbi:hypothetical protein M2169_002886 [Streptomyces sp. MJP52]|nr:hypothetical protein [Streptomyces sp. MJP52]
MPRAGRGAGPWNRAVDPVARLPSGHAPREEPDPGVRAHGAHGAPGPAARGFSRSG